MSILIEKIAKSGEISSNLYPPGNVTNVILTPTSNSVSISWNDPNDTIIGNSKISEWLHTLLIRKQGSYPTSPSDGDIVIDNYERNKYNSSNELNDTGLDINVTYYYRFFTYNINNICNNSGDMIYSAITKINADPILSNNDWETIIKIADSGQGQDIWNIGDEIDFPLSENSNLKLHIADFNHFDKSNGSGKANICFVCKDIYKINTKMNTIDNCDGGWVNMSLKTTEMENIYNEISQKYPSLKDGIKNVNIEYNHGSGFDESTDTYSGKVFILSRYELGDNSRPTIGNKLSYYTTSTTRKKYYNGSIYEYWVRDCNRENWFYYMDKYGMASSYMTPNQPCGVVFCFNI